VLRVQATPGRVSKQADIGTRRRTADPVEQVGQYRIPNAAALMLGKHGHVDELEEAAAVADNPAHRDGFPARFVDDVTGGPAAP